MVSKSQGTHDNVERAFADFVDHWGNDGLWRWSKELSAFAQLWGWGDILAVDDKQLFERRAAALKRIVMRVSYARFRAGQIADAGYPLVVLRSEAEHSGQGCGRVHSELNGLILNADDPMLQHFPLPALWDCSCFVFGARHFRDAERKGGKPEKQPPPWFKPGALNDDMVQRVDPIFCIPDGPDLKSILALIASGATDLG